MSDKRDNTKWIGRGAWAIADQGVFALANVLLNILLARWLSLVEYGAFAVAYSVFLFIGAFHTALLTEPMLVFGSGKFAKQAQAYLQILSHAHWTLMAIGSGLLIVVGAVLNFLEARPLAQALFGLAIATPFSLLMWFSRRAAYLRGQPRMAAFAGAGYLILDASGLFVLARADAVSIFAAMIVMGAASAITGFWLLRRVRSEIPNEEHKMQAVGVLNQHWQYGRWASATSVLMWIPLNFFFVVLSVFVNFEASATLKALSNLVLPLLQANAALGALLLPAMVRRTGKSAQFKRILRVTLMLFALGGCSYSILIALLGPAMIHQFYSGRYDSHASMLWPLLLIPLLDGAMVVLANALRSLERPDLVFWAQFAVGTFVLSVGVVATRSFGLWGAAGAIAFADVLGGMILGACVLGNLQSQSRRGAVQAIEATI